MLTLEQQAQLLNTQLTELMRRTCAAENCPDLPIAQLRVLYVLFDGPRSVSAVSRELGVSVSATTQLADRMEAAGLVVRISESADRRQKSLRLTGHGESLVRQRRDQRVARLAQALTQMSPSQRDKALEIVEALLQAARVTSPQQILDDVILPRQDR